MQQYINLNGSYYKAEEPVIHHTNRGFQYGDALFEWMHANGTHVQFFSDHIQRLTSSLSTLKMDIPGKIKNHGIYREITRLLHKNRHLKGAKVRLTVFRNTGGDYAPSDPSCSYIIESYKLPEDSYPFNSRGLLLDVYTGMTQPLHPLINVKTTHRMVHTLAGVFKVEKSLDECLLLNTREEVTGAISSNVFLVRHAKLFTPPLASGCLDGVMRKNIIKLALQSGWEVDDQHPLEMEDFLHAEEVFLTNAIEGIQWVSGIGKKRYFKSTAKKLHLKLNERTALD